MIRVIVLLATYNAKRLREKRPLGIEMSERRDTFKSQRIRERKERLAYKLRLIEQTAR